jgi:hypothetical protein
MNLWIEVAVMATLFALGNILFGHFEERTPKWRRVLKFFVMMTAITAISATAGRVWSASVLAALFAIAAVIHAWWLPKHGINGLTAEPRDKYYALRGWKP